MRTCPPERCVSMSQDSLLVFISSQSLFAGFIAFDEGERILIVSFSYEISPAGLMMSREYRSLMACD